MFCGFKSSRPDGLLLFTQLEEMSHSHSGDHFHVNHPETNWRSCVEHAEKLGLGTRAYQLIKI